MSLTAIEVFTNDWLQPALDPDDADTLAILLPASNTYGRGQVLGEFAATPGTYGAYDDAANDGLQTAKAILPCACVVDANGKITYGTTADPLHAHATVPVWVGGTFDTTELLGLDAAAVADLGRLIKGTTLDGLLQLI